MIILFLLYNLVLLILGITSFYYLFQDINVFLGAPFIYKLVILAGSLTPFYLIYDTLKLFIALFSGVENADSADNE